MTYVSCQLITKRLKMYDNQGYDIERLAFLASLFRLCALSSFTELSCPVDGGIVILEETCQDRNVSSQAYGDHTE